MIATDTQYNVTARKLSKLRETLAFLASGSESNPFARAQQQSVENLSKQLQSELGEYETLKAGNFSELPVETLADLPRTLIRARIVRGLNQSQLAELIGVRPQQIQRWENDEYSNVGFEALKAIAGALNLRIKPQVVLLSEQPVAPSQLRKALAKAGLPKAIFDRHLLPRSKGTGMTSLDELSARLEKLFGFGAHSALSLQSFQQSAMQFKLPANAVQARTRAYAAYLNGLCKIVSKCVPQVSFELPGSIAEMHDFLFEEGISLKSAVERCWLLNIAVIPTDDSIGFNGACWRQNGKAVIVLRNSGSEESRAIFDLLHELFHFLAAGKGDLALLEDEETSKERLNSDEERRADRYAAEVVTRGQLGGLLGRIVKDAGGYTPQLKVAVQDAAKSTSIPVGIIANLLAKQISETQGNPSWWATARTLQPKGEPWKVMRNTFVEHADLSNLDRVEREFLMQILETPDDRDE